MIVDSQSLGLGRLSRGVGDANCPSAEQLQGIQDCSDPCQASTAPCVAPGTTTTTAASNLATASAFQACSAAGGTWNANGTCSQGPAILTGISPEVVAIAGGLFLALALLLGRRR